MNDFGAYEDDMARFSKLSDQDVERLLAGKDVSGGDDLDELAAFVRTVSAFANGPDGVTEARHLSAMVEAAQASRTADAQSRSEESIAGVSTRRRLVLRNPLSSLVAKLVLVGIVVLALFSGAASAGKLPNGVQGPVADVAGNVGLSLPDADDEGDVDDGEMNNVDDGPQGNVDDGAQNNVDDGAQGNVDDGAQNNVDDGPQGNVDDGAQNNVDDGAQNSVEDGAQGNVDDGQQGNDDDGDQGNEDDRPPAPQAPPAPQGQGNQGGNGNQGNGDN